MLWLLSALALAAGPAPLEFPSAPTCDGGVWRSEIAMVGDIMQHGMQLRASTQPDGSYSWRGVFDPVAPILRSADLAIGNLETPIAGDADPTRPGYSGYPFFNAPDALLDALDAAGFDILQTANNHCLDRGELGALATLDALDAHGFAHTGVFRSPEDRNTAFAWHTLPGGVQVGMAAYTYGTNGVPMPPDKPWLVNWLDEGQMQGDVAALREAGADLVIVGLHWGREYQHAPQPWQVDLANRLVDAGADIVMGGHPHVLQPASVVQRTDGVHDRDALILYSLGNFVSNQRTPNRDGGVIARVGVAHCPTTGRTWLERARFTPVWVDDRLDRRELAFRVLPTVPADATCGGPELTAVDCANMTRFRDHTATLLPPASFTVEAGTTQEIPAPDVLKRIREGWSWTLWAPQSLPSRNPVEAPVWPLVWTRPTQADGPAR